MGRAGAQLQSQQAGGRDSPTGAPQPAPERSAWEQDGRGHLPMSQDSSRGCEVHPSSRVLPPKQEACQGHRETTQTPKATSTRPMQPGPEARPSMGTASLTMPGWARPPRPTSSGSSKKPSQQPQARERSGGCRQRGGRLSSGAAATDGRETAPMLELGVPHPHQCAPGMLTKE